MCRWILGTLFGALFVLCYLLMIATIYFGALGLTDVLDLDGLVRWLLLTLSLVPVIVMSVMSGKYVSKRAAQGSKRR